MFQTCEKLRRPYFMIVVEQYLYSTVFILGRLLGEFRPTLGSLPLKVLDFGLQRVQDLVQE